MKQTVYPFNRFSVNNILSVLAVAAIYLLLSAVLIGFKTDQLALVLFFALLYFTNAGTRKFILGFSIFIVYWIVFDYMKAFPNYRFADVHIQDLYNFEKYLFGIRYNNSVITPNEFWLQNKHAFLDAMSGIFYLCWIPVPLLFAAFLFYRNREEFLKFSFTFFWVNIAGFIVYYSFPAAPPWYIHEFGNSFHAQTPGNAAGLLRFDTMFNVQVFESLYSKSSNVFAAMPSLHAAYPLIVLYYGIRNRLGLINILFAIIAMGIWFAAVYSTHHYILDIIAGILCFIIGTMTINKIFRLKYIQQLIQRYLEIIQ